MSLLYEDKYVRITEEGVTIRRYFFPTFQSTTVPWSAIKCFQLEPVNFLKSKGWGMGLSNVWWAMDLGRQFSRQQRKFCSISVSSEGRKCKCGLNPRKGFSCVNLAKVQDIMGKRAGTLLSTGGTGKAEAC